MEKRETGIYHKVRPYLDLRENFYDLARITLISAAADYLWIGEADDAVIDSPLKSALSGAGFLDGYFRGFHGDEHQNGRNRRGATRCLTVGLMIGEIKLLCHEHNGFENYMIDVFDSALRYGAPCILVWLLRSDHNSNGGRGDDGDEPIETPPIQPEKNDEPDLDSDHDIPKPIKDRMKSRNLF